TDITWIGNRSGPVKDTDVFNFALSDFMYDKFTRAGGVASKVFVPQAEASRTEVAIEAFTTKQPQESVCPVLEGRTLVKFA
ncbi:hypothetical protein DYB32_010082, partial [Aphanomyces invadans]